MIKQVRTRFAPSPTGFLHVGGVRTALFAWLIARQHGGKFILRSEDTDKAREIEGSEKHIQDSLRWIGIDWDEGTDIQGHYKPYRQSERLTIYKEWAQKLVDLGRAYVDPYTKEQVNEFRESAKQNKTPFVFRNHRPENPPKWDGTQPLRLKSEPKEYTWIDAVMGELHTGPEVIDDFIIIKADGYPTYNFCHIVDDELMKITHVIRSQEFLSSVPKYLNLYEALEITPPIMATLPFVMNNNGKKKLGKRDGAKDILDYARLGYLPEAMMNFLATLGWNDGTEQEIFTREELINKFSLERVQKSGALFDEERLLWMNGTWIRSLSIDELYNRCNDFWPKSAKESSKDFKISVLGLVHERLKYFAELDHLTNFFFKEPEVVKEQLLDNKLSLDDCTKFLGATIEQLEDNSFGIETLDKQMRELCDELDTKPGNLFRLLRVAITGTNIAPGLFETMNVLGKDETIKRIKKALDSL